MTLMEGTFLKRIQANEGMGKPNGETTLEVNKEKLSFGGGQETGDRRRRELRRKERSKEERSPLQDILPVSHTIGPNHPF